MITIFPMEFSGRAGEVSMRKGEVCAQQVDAGRTLTVTEGLVWVTLEGEAADHVLQRGSRLVFPKRGRVVVQAMRGPARYK